MIQQLTTAETYPLRKSVLRDGTQSDVVEFEGDDDPDTVHLGWRVGGEVVAISTWMHRSYYVRPFIDAYQLRGMVTSPSIRGTGVGSKVLLAGLDHCRSRGAQAVWARARDSAVQFYEAHGFGVVGDGYIDGETGEPHHDMFLLIPDSIPDQANPEI
jgi:predicted GNAT family N-acyltransferase